MHDGLDITTVIFALLAVFVVWKLKAVLGARVDIDRRAPNRTENPSETGAGGSVVRLPGAADPATSPSQPFQRLDEFASTAQAQASLRTIIAADRTFDPARFLSGAKMAYEMIVGAFAAGDGKTLGALLSPDVLRSFLSVVDQRAAAGQQASTRFVSIDAADIADATLKEGVAQISVRFAAKMINVVRDKSGEVASGDPETVVTTDDLWTFARPVGSSDPAWKLIATESGHHP